MDDHLDVHYSDYPRIWPCIGQIKAVKAKDHANNTTGTFTLYDLTVHMQWPPTNHDYENVPAAGQMAGGAVELEITYAVDQYVLVGFVEGDPNRPYIQQPWPYHNTAVSHAEGEGPRVRLTCNDTVVTIDNSGGVDIQLKASAQMRWLDSNGTVLARILEGGSIDLGGVSGLKQLMTEDMINIFNTHTHTGVTAGMGATGVPAPLLSTGSHATAQVRGK